jgi:dephospho-CoA kinase
MAGIVLAFAGAIGVGKSSLSENVATLLGWPRVSFGDYVRKVARQNGQNDKDRAVLQRLGQALVRVDVDDFVDCVLKGAPDWRPGDNLVIDGLRHAEVRLALIHKVKPSTLKVVVVKVDEDTRQERAKREKDIDPRMLSRYDQDITEAQIARILPEYADFEVDNTLPVNMAAEQVRMRLGLASPAMVAE